MKIFIKHVLRNLKENKKRTFLMMLSLFFTGVFISIILTGYIFIDKILVEISKSMDSNYDFIVRSRDDDTPITNEQLEDLFHGNAFYHFEGYESGQVNNKDTQLIVINLENSQKFGYLVPKNKKETYTLEKNEVIIPKALAKNLNLKEGDSFVFVNSEGFEFNLKLKYIVEKDSLFSLGEGIVISEDDFKDLMGMEELSIYRYQVLLNKKISDEEYQKIKEEANIINLEVTTFGEEAEDVNMLEAMGDELDQFILVFALLSIVLLVIIYFVNNSLVKIILNERVPVTGTFRSVGASRGKMNFILIIEMAMYGLFAGLPSSVVGFLIMKLGASATFSEEEDASFALDISSVFNNNIVLILSVSILTVILIQLLLSIKEIIKCNKISVKDSIFSKYDNLFVYKYKDLIIGIALLLVGIIAIILHKKISEIFGFIGIVSLIVSFTKVMPFITKIILEKVELKKVNLYKLARDNAMYGKLQMGNNTILGILFIITMLLIFNANYSIKEYKDKKDGYSFDIIIEEMDLSNLQQDRVKSIEGVENLYVISSSTTDFSTIYYKLEFYLANVKFKTLEFMSSKDFDKIAKLDTSYSNDISNTTLASNLKDNEVILDESFLEKNNINVGDYVNFTTKITSKELSDEIPIYLKIVGTHSLGDKVLIISEELRDELDTLYPFGNKSYIVTKEGVDNNQVNDKIKKILYTEEELKELEKDPETTRLNLVKIPMTNEEYLKDMLKSAKSGLKENILICLGIAIVMSICLVNNQKVSFIQRKKEFATLYSLCMSRSQLKSLITLEILISYFITAIISIVYMFLLKYLVEFTMEAGGMSIGFSVSIIYMILILISILSIILLMSIKIVKEVDRLNIVEEIKYE